jgi:hypothetical protein
MPDVRAILAERRAQHGSLVNHARVSQAMKRREAGEWIDG